MSRNIDLSKPPSDEDKAYLVSRNRGHLIPEDSEPAEAPEVEPTDADTEEAPEEQPTDDADDSDDSDGDDSEESDADGEAAGEYGAMKAEELKALLTARDLPTSGNKPELIARLEASDSES